MIIRTARIALAIGLTLALFACGGGTSRFLDVTELPPTGMEPTKEWIEYNKLAEAKGLPRLGYAVLCIDISERGLPRGLVSSFDTNDPRACLFIRLETVNIGDTYRIEWLDPRGAHHTETVMSHATGASEWAAWSAIHVKRVAARLPGVWTVRLYINDNIVLGKQVPIDLPSEDAQQAESGSEGDPATEGPLALEGASAVAFRDFLVEGTAGLKYKSRIPAILQQRFAMEHPEFNGISPSVATPLLPLPKGISANRLTEILAGSPPVKALFDARNARLIVTGHAQGAWVEQDINRIEVHAIDVRTGRSRTTAARFTLPPVKADESFHDWMAVVGNKLYDQLMAEHGDFVLAALRP